jgi:hypothetical protein
VKRAAWYVVCGVALLSFVVWLAIASLWLRSHRGQGGFEFRHGGLLWELSLRDGKLRIDNEPQRRVDRAEWERKSKEAEQAYNRAAEAEQRAWWSAAPSVFGGWGAPARSSNSRFWRKGEEFEASPTETYEEQIQQKIAFQAYQRWRANADWWDVWVHPPRTPTRNWSAGAALPAGAVRGNCRTLGS